MEDGAALLLTGTHTGTLVFSATVADHDPGANTNEYEDVLEISFQSQAGTRIRKRKTVICCRSGHSLSPSHGWSKAQARNSPTGAARADAPLGDVLPPTRRGGPMAHRSPARQGEPTPQRVDLNDDHRDLVADPNLVA